jgi:hypothetical protein
VDDVGTSAEPRLGGGTAAADHPVGVHSGVLTGEHLLYRVEYGRLAEIATDARRQPGPGGVPAPGRATRSQRGRVLL